jgi:hypothetical protein
MILSLLPPKLSYNKFLLGWGQGGEMKQALNAHMNNKRKGKKQINKFLLFVALSFMLPCDGSHRKLIKRLKPLGQQTHKAGEKLESPMSEMMQIWT